MVGNKISVFYSFDVLFFQVIVGLSMTIEFEISEKYQVILTRTFGPVQGVELVYYQQEMLKHPLFRPDLRQLIDMSRSDLLTFEPEDIKSLPYVFDRTAKRAILATSTLNFGLSRLVQIQRTDKHYGTLLVCHTREEALDWIELELEDYFDLCKEVGLSII